MWTALLIIAAGFFLPAQGIVSNQTFDNCIFLGNNRLQLSWTVRRNDSTIDFQLCGCDEDDRGMSTANEYMGFGLSRNTTATVMLGADATIAWVDTNLGPRAVDYYLSGYVQCRNGVGACPDTMDSSGGCTNDVSNVSGFRREGLQCVSFTRSFTTNDQTCDVSFDVDNQQYIVWAVGGLGETAFIHFRRAMSTDPPIRLGREPANECTRGLRCPNCPPFREVVFNATARNETFVATIGPPGNERGYMAITNRAGWGFAWYINGSLIPHLVVERGFTYMFISQGGNNPNANNYHPFYITDSIRGGRLRNTQTQRNREVVYAGFDANDMPIGIGPYCEFTETAASRDILNTCGPQEDYFNSLMRSDCPTPGSSFTWTPNETTPNVVYYQCATHLNFGYKITVMPLLEDRSHAPKLVAYATTTLLMFFLTLTLP